MKKFTVLSVFFILTALAANTQSTAPIPSCACNNIATQINIDKKTETQIQKAIEKMDEEANHLEHSTPIQKQTSQSIPKHKRFWQR